MNSVAFSPDGKLLATAGVTGRCGCGTSPTGQSVGAPPPNSPPRGAA